jgi:hypothetical protein
MSSETPNLWRHATLYILEHGALPDALIFDSSRANLPGIEEEGHLEYWGQFQVGRLLLSHPYYFGCTI